MNTKKQTNEYESFSWAVKLHDIKSYYFDVMYNNYDDNNNELVEAITKMQLEIIKIIKEVETIKINCENNKE